MAETSETTWAEALTTQWDDAPLFRFVEDENCNITGYGHQDPSEFASEVNRYDAVTSGEMFADDEQWTADVVGHRWATPSDDGEALDWRGVTEATPGAIPITTLWGQR